MAITIFSHLNSMDSKVLESTSFNDPRSVDLDKEILVILVTVIVHESYPYIESLTTTYLVLRYSDSRGKVAANCFVISPMPAAGKHADPSVNIYI